MIKKLHSFSNNKNNKNQQNGNYPTAITQPKNQPKVIQNQTFTQFRDQLKYVQQKIKALQSKKFSIKDNQWGTLKSDMKQILALIKLSRLKKVFERKFQEQIKLLNDFYGSKYHQSMFRFCFFCCPVGILRQLKYYKFIDDIFELSISDVQKTHRNIYFYVNLLYIKLFLMFVAVGDRMTQEFNKKMIQAMAVESKQSKIIQKRKKQVGQLEQINDVFVMQQKQFKDTGKNQQIIASYIVQSDNPAKIVGKVQPREPLDVDLMRQNYYDEFKKLHNQIQQIITKDWKDIINCQQWSSQSYYGFIEVDGGQAISTSLQFKDCKLKTSHLFDEVSSSSFDLRTYLVRRSRSKSRGYQYILKSLNEDSVDFKLRFWLSQGQRTKQNHDNIEKFLLLSMRIGIKEKIYRNCSKHYKQRTQNWMIHNYVHMSFKQHSNNQLNLMTKSKIGDNINKNDSEDNNDSSYRSITQNGESKLTPQMFWWVNLGQNLIRAVVQVANQKIREQKQILMNMRKSSSSKKRSKLSSIQNTNNEYNPQSIDRLAKQQKNINNNNRGTNINNQI